MTSRLRNELDMRSREQETEEKKYTGLTCASKDTINKKNNQPTKWEKILPITDHTLISSIYIYIFFFKLLQINKKTLLKKIGKSLGHFTEEGISMLTST